MVSSFFRELKVRLWEYRVLDLSAQLAYYFLLSFFPFLLLAVTMLAYLPVSSLEVLSAIEPYTPPEAYEFLRDSLTEVLDERRGGVLSFSLVVTVWLALNAFHSVIRILDGAYGVKTDRPFWKEAMLGFFLMVGLLVGLAVTLALSVFGKMVGEHVFRWFGVSAWFYGAAWPWIRWVLSSFTLLMVFLVLYTLAPNTRVTVRQALPGSLFATFGWQVSSWGFSYYVTKITDYSFVYGNLGTIIILVIWFYLTALVLILGGLINASLCKVREKKPPATSKESQGRSRV
ncbi:YihY/virulence factor BrkB family protein [Staphylospora marina]|uniref:YihY/virulence factor BrkB family protein n=1 Tax=Staphylospora marina TaxID=2490858 RepID=UPI0013DE35CA|nr:YihY/virulence factor BrkB family protein [Staphylospora marina]